MVEQHPVKVICPGSSPGGPANVSLAERSRHQTVNLTWRNPNHRFESCRVRNIHRLGLNSLQEWSVGLETLDWEEIGSNPIW